MSMEIVPPHGFILWRRTGVFWTIAYGSSPGIKIRKVDAIFLEQVQYLTRARKETLINLKLISVSLMYLLIIADALLWWKLCPRICRAA
jgi:hypothetical protein